MTGSDRGTTVRPSLRAAAVLWVLAAVVYLTTETVSARAFPGYSYARNYISDLGVPERVRLGTRLVDSPLATVMNAGFVAQGVLFALAAVVAARALRRERRDNDLALLVLLAVVHAVGNVLVAVVHGGAPFAGAGRLPLHAVGAGMAIVGGNLALLVAGMVLRRLGVARPWATAGIVLGVAGLVSVVGLSTLPGPVPGVWERGAVYSITLWELAVGVVLLRPRTGRLSSPAPV